MLRPNPIPYTNLRYWFPFTAIEGFDGVPVFMSLGPTGTSSPAAAMYAEVTTYYGSFPQPDTVFGAYDYAQHGTQFRLDGVGGGGAQGSYPTGTPWTATFGGWYRSQPGGNQNLFYRFYGGGSGQLLMYKIGNRIMCAGYFGGTGQYLFPDNDPPFYALAFLADYPDDGGWHFVVFTVTNDSTGSGGGLVNTYIDGQLVSSNQGRGGQYFESDQLYNFAGAYTDSDNDSALHDVFFYDDDHSANIPGWYQNTPYSFGGMSVTSVTVDGSHNVTATGSISPPGSGTFAPFYTLWWGILLDPVHNLVIDVPIVGGGLPNNTRIRIDNGWTQVDTWVVPDGQNWEGLQIVLVAEAPDASRVVSSPFTLTGANWNRSHSGPPPVPPLPPGPPAGPTRGPTIGAPGPGVFRSQTRDFSLRTGP